MRGKRYKCMYNVRKPQISSIIECAKKKPLGGFTIIDTNREIDTILIYL